MDKAFKKEDETRHMENVLSIAIYDRLKKSDVTYTKIFRCSDFFLFWDNI